MPIYDIYSKREKRAAKTGQDVFVYDRIPQTLRIQIWNIFEDILNPPNRNPSASDVKRWFEESQCFIHRTLCHEYGRLYLYKNINTIKFHYMHEYEKRGRDLRDFLINSPETNIVFDCIEMIARYLEMAAIKYPTLKKHAQQLIEEINFRFLEADVGYQFENGQIIRIDSKLAHQEIVKPALALLARQEFAGANAEYMAGHAAYRHGDYKTAATELTKAFESVLQIICQCHSWPFTSNDRAVRLLGICFDNGLIPSQLQSQFKGLRACLESVPTIRNNSAAHGQGADIKDIPQYMVEYIVNQTAAAILLLVGASDGYNQGKMTS